MWKRLLITVGVGDLVYTVASFFPPYDNSFRILLAPLVGCMLTAIVVTIVLLPLRAFSYGIAPQSSEKVHGFITAAILVGAITALTLLLPATVFSGSRIGFWSFLSVYSLSLVISFFWPHFRRGGAKSQ
jgi:hypothetical protein